MSRLTGGQCKVEQGSRGDGGKEKGLEHHAASFMSWRVRTAMLRRV